MSKFPIPKIIHLSYKSKEEIIPEWKDVLSAWKKTNPTWEIKFWSDKDNEELVLSEFPWFYKTYKNFKYNIQRADAVRCCYLFKYGGLYIDMDYLPLNNIDKLFYNEQYNKNVNDNQIYLTLNTNGLVYFNSFMASKPGNNFWIEYLKSIMKTIPKWYWSKYFYVYNTTGPFKLSENVKNYNSVIGLINPSLIHSCEVCDIENNKNLCKSIYFKRLKGQTWNSIDSKIINYFICNKILCILIFFIIMYLLFYFSSKKYICKYRCE
jgi:mannosyltransferase OCH1-like enzyme